MGELIHNSMEKTENLPVIANCWWKSKLEMRWLILSNKTDMVCFNIRHIQETSVNQLSTQPSTMQHLTAALRHNVLENK